MMTKAPVSTSAAVGEETTYWKATRELCVGSVARCAGTRYSIARKARNDPASSLSAPRTIEYLVPAHRATEPTQMYLVAFQYVVSSPTAALVLTGAFVII